MSHGPEGDQGLRPSAHDSRDPAALSANPSASPPTSSPIGLSPPDPKLTPRTETSAAPPPLGMDTNTPPLNTVTPGRVTPAAREADLRPYPGWDPPTLVIHTAHVAGPADARPQYHSPNPAPASSSLSSPPPPAPFYVQPTTAPPPKPDVSAFGSGLADPSSGFQRLTTPMIGVRDNVSAPESESASANASLGPTLRNGPEIPVVPVTRTMGGSPSGADPSPQRHAAVTPPDPHRRPGASSEAPPAPDADAPNSTSNWSLDSNATLLPGKSNYGGLPVWSESERSRDPRSGSSLSGMQSQSNSADNTPASQAIDAFWDLESEKGKPSAFSESSSINARAADVEPDLDLVHDVVSQSRIPSRLQSREPISEAAESSAELGSRPEFLPLARVLHQPSSPTAKDRQTPPSPPPPSPSEPAAAAPDVANAGVDVDAVTQRAGNVRPKGDTAQREAGSRPAIGSSRDGMADSRGQAGSATGGGSALNSLKLAAAFFMGAPLPFRAPKKTTPEGGPNPGGIVPPPIVPDAEPHAPRRIAGGPAPNGLRPIAPPPGPPQRHDRRDWRDPHIPAPPSPSPLPSPSPFAEATPVAQVRRPRQTPNGGGANAGGGIPASVTSPVAGPPMGDSVSTYNQRREPRYPTIDGYDILEKVGEGGMGVVYKARQRSLNRLVALKMIARSHMNEDVRSRFYNEAELLAQLHHPNILQIYDIGESNGVPFFTMELLGGGNLREWLNIGLPTIRQGIGLMVALARGTHAAHERGIIHRDLKPSNIMFPRDGVPQRGSTGSVGGSDTRHSGTIHATEGMPKITDFGLAKNLEDDQGNTITGLPLGTPSYMAPEQARGEKLITPAADVYALGAILYEMLTSRPPFKAASSPETIHQVIHLDPVPPSRINPRVPRDLETICLKCLTKEPQKRYPTAEDLAADLERLRRGEPILARPTPVWERAWKWSRRHPTTTALSIAVAVLVFSTFGIWGWNQNRKRIAENERNQVINKLSDDNFNLVGTIPPLVEKKKFKEAREILALVKGQVENRDDRGRLEPIKSRIAELEKDVDAKEKEIRQSDDVWKHFAKFLLSCEQAQFRDLSFVGVDPTRNISQTRSAAQEALTYYADETPPGSNTWRLRATPAELLGKVPAELLGKIPAELLGKIPAELQNLGDQGAKLADHAIQREFEKMLLVLADSLAKDIPKSMDAASGAEFARKRAREALAVLDQVVDLKEQPAYHLRRARLLRQAGDAEGDAKEREIARTKTPKGEIDHFHLGWESYGRDGGEAIRHFKNALQQNPKSFWSQILLAISLLQRQSAAESRAYLDSSLSEGRSFPWQYILRGLAKDMEAIEKERAALLNVDRQDELRKDAADLIQGANQDYDKASKDIVDGLKDKTIDEITGRDLKYALLVNRGEALYGRAKLYASSPLPERKTKAKELLGEAAAQFREAIREEGTYFLAYYSLSKVYQELREYDKALEMLNKAVNRQDKKSLLYRDRARLVLSDPKLLREKSGKALEDLDRAIGLDVGISPDAPSDAFAHIPSDAFARIPVDRRADVSEDQANRARVLLQLQRIEDALKAAKIAVDLNPSNAEAYYWYVSALMELGRYDEAVKVGDRYFSVTRIKPSVNMYRIRGLGNVARGDYAGAVADFTQGLELLKRQGSLIPPSPTPTPIPTVAYPEKSPKNTDPSSDVPTPGKNAGDTHNDELRRRALPLYLARGGAYLLQNANQPALSDYNQALILAPDHPEALIGRARAHIMQNQYAEAAQDANRALVVVARQFPGLAEPVSGTKIPDASSPSPSPTPDSGASTTSREALLIHHQAARVLASAMLLANEDKQTSLERTYRQQAQSALQTATRIAVAEAVAALSAKSKTPDAKTVAAAGNEARDRFLTERVWIDPVLSGFITDKELPLCLRNAVRSADALVREHPDDPRVLQHAARVYAKAMQDAQALTKRLRYGRTALNGDDEAVVSGLLADSGRYAARSRELLFQASAKLRNDTARHQFWRNQILEDPVFASVLRAEDRRRWRTELLDQLDARIQASGPASVSHEELHQAAITCARAGAEAAAMVNRLGPGARDLRQSWLARSRSYAEQAAARLDTKEQREQYWKQRVMKDKDLGQIR